MIPASGKRNMGMYRLQVYDPQTLGMHWQLHKGGAEHWRRSGEASTLMEVAIAIGAEPVLLYSATAPLPPDVDELVFAGFLRGSSVDMVRAQTVDILVPARAEIVLEGYVDPAESPAWRARLVTTPATTRSPSPTRCSTSRR